MNTLRVGPTLIIIAMLATAMPAIGAHPDSYKENFHVQDNTWIASSGELTWVHNFTWAPETHNQMGHRPSWLRLQDADGPTQSDSVAYKAASEIDSTMTSYKLEVTMERGDNFTAPGNSAVNSSAIGAVFGLASDGYFLFSVDTDAGKMHLGVPDGSGGHTIAKTDNYTGSPAYTALGHVEWQHRYGVIVEDRDITFVVDDFPVAHYDLDVVAPSARAPVGTIGFYAADDTQVFANAVAYRPYDDTAPEIELEQYPEPGTLNIAGVPAQPWLADENQSIVIGDELTFSANITDDLLGLERIWVAIDGKVRHDLSFGNDPEDGLYSWTIDTSNLRPGDHTITIRAMDQDHNFDVDGVSFDFTLIPTDPLGAL